MPASRCKIAFSPDDFGNRQKEKVFTSLLESHMVAGGYIVAKPEPDLGDDLWFVERENVVVRRAQIKSAHKCTIQSEYPDEKPREYNVRFQVETLRKWLNSPRGYVYFFAMSDNRFHGLAEGSLACGERDELLRVDMTQMISDPPPLEFVEQTAEKSVTIDHYRTVNRGFHFGCMPCSWFKGRAEKWSGKANSVWIKVHLRKAADSATYYFTYHIGSDCVSKYFGQLDVGLDEASKEIETSFHV
jgi:hypothetical protein